MGGSEHQYEYSARPDLSFTPYGARYVSCTPSRRQLITFQSGLLKLKNGDYLMARVIGAGGEPEDDILQAFVISGYVNRGLSMQRWSSIVP